MIICEFLGVWFMHTKITRRMINLLREGSRVYLLDTQVGKWGIVCMIYTKQIYTTRDINFFEEKFPYATSDHNFDMTNTLPLRERIRECEFDDEPSFEDHNANEIVDEEGLINTNPHISITNIMNEQH